MISNGFIDTKCTDEEVKNFYDTIENFKNKCKENPELEDCEMANSDIQVSNGKDVNGFISKFSQTTVDIYLVIARYNGEIDFNSLKSKKNITIIGNHDIEECYWAMESDGQNVLSTKEKQKRFVKKLMKSINDAKNFAQKQKSSKAKQNQKALVPLSKRSTKESKIQIVGNIRNKVPFLVFFYGNYEIVKSDLNCQNLYICMISLQKSSYKIKSDFFVQQYYSEEEDGESLKLTSEYVQAGEYDVALDQDGTIFAENIRISCYDKSVKIFKLVGEEYVDIGFSYSYDMMNKFGLVTAAKVIDIYKADEKISQVKNINITVLSRVNIPGGDGEGGDEGGEEVVNDVQNHKSLLAKSVIKITETNWENSDIRPEITFTFDKELYEIDTKEIKTLTVKQVSFEEARNMNKIEENGKKKNKTGMIVGIVVVCVVVVAVVVVVVVIVIKKKNKVANQPSN